MLSIGNFYLAIFIIYCGSFGIFYFIPTFIFLGDRKREGKGKAPLKLLEDSEDS